MYFRALTIAALLTASVPVFAGTTYTYTGSAFNFSEVNNMPQNPPGTVAAPYTGESVTGSFTITGNADNLNNQVLNDVGSFSFTDGAQTLTNANATLFAYVSTDASGDITSYVIQAASSTVSIDDIQIGSIGSPASFGRIELSPTDIVSALTNTVGSFAPPVTVTPEPGSFVLLGTGLLGAVGAVRRRFAA